MSERPEPSELAALRESSPDFVSGFLEAIEIVLVDGQTDNALKAIRAFRARLEKHPR